MAFGRVVEAVPGAAAQAAVADRVGFIRRTYAHLAGAITAFVLLEVLFFKTPIAAKLTLALAGTPYAWLLVLGGFMAVGWVADYWARSATSTVMQYLGLALYVVAEAVIFVPLLFIAAYFSDPSVIPTAGLLTLLVFAGLTLTVFITGKDFSFLRGILIVSAFAALGVIIAGIVFGFQLGLVFSSIMVVVAGAYVLYYTSNVMLHYRTDQHVSAALSLFAAIALLFWYILRIVIALSGRD